MPDERPEDARSTAVDHLKALGLSTYAARTFVALVRLDEGTAQDVSQVADVPRTRVYDAADELIDHGLVDIQRSNPRRYWAISAETAGRHFDQTFARRVNDLTSALDDLETTTRTTEQRGVWTVTGRDSVTERTLEFIDSADEEVVYMTVDTLLTEPLAGRLSDAADRGVTVRLAEMSPDTTARLDRHVPDAEPFESTWDWTNTPAGRLLMVDGRKTLVSVLVNGNGDHPPEPRDETAIWGSGETNGLVVVLKAMFTWQLDDTNDP